MSVNMYVAVHKCRWLPLHLCSCTPFGRGDEATTPYTDVLNTWTGMRKTENATRFRQYQQTTRHRVVSHSLAAACMLQLLLSMVPKFMDTGTRT